MRLRYVGSYYDITGYGEAARNTIKALDKVGIDLTIEPYGSIESKVSFGNFDSYIKKLEKRYDTFDIQIIHTPPEAWSGYRSDKYTIGYVLWETQELPNGWAEAANRLLNEVWTTNTTARDMFVEQGMTIPVMYIPHCVDIDEINATRPFQIYNLPDRPVKYLAIQHIQSRKNLFDLISAFYVAFGCKLLKDEACLILKLQGTTDAKQILLNIKEQVKLPCYPNIYLIDSMLYRSELFGLYKIADCFVSCSSGEAFNLPLCEAMASGLPVITPTNDGAVDFVTEESGWFIRTTTDYVTNMQMYNYYDSTLTWQKPDRYHLMELFRQTALNKKMLIDKGKFAKKYITENFSHIPVGNTMRDRIEVIYNGRQNNT